MKTLKKIISNKIFFHFSFWITLFILTFISISRYDDLLFSFQFSTILIGSQIIPIYVHSFIFEKYFQKKKYYLYAFITFLIIVGFGYFNNRLFALFFNEVNVETYLSLTIFMYMFTGFKYFKIGSKQQFRLDLEEKKRIKAENELLKSQVNPHFMFNTLNSIYSLIMSKDDLAGEVVMKLSGLMRYLLDNSKNKTVSLKHECDFLNNYIELERIRLGERCDIKFEISGDYEGKSIAPMLLIPFVENAFKHGISVSKNLNFINVFLIVNDNTVSFIVENRIAPNSNILHSKQNKIGIKNVTQRLNILYSGKHDLKIITSNDIYKINLKINI